LYAGEVGLYAGEVGLYAGEVGLYAGEVGLYAGEVGLYTGEVGLYAGEVGLYAGEVGLYTGEVWAGRSGCSQERGLLAGALGAIKRGFLLTGCLLSTPTQAQGAPWPAGGAIFMLALVRRPPPPADACATTC
jgi:hypothetical protein